MKREELEVGQMISYGYETEKVTAIGEKKCLLMKSNGDERLFDLSHLGGYQVVPEPKKLYAYHIPKHGDIYFSTDSDKKSHAVRVPEYDIEYPLNNG